MSPVRKRQIAIGFFTVDRGILNKARTLTSMRIANPVEFFGGD